MQNFNLVENDFHWSYQMADYWTVGNYGKMSVRNELILMSDYINDRKPMTLGNSKMWFLHPFTKMCAIKKFEDLRL